MEDETGYTFIESIKCISFIPMQINFETYAHIIL